MSIQRPKVPLYQAIARAFVAYQNCCADPQKAEWRDRHRERIERLVKQYMPSGSGIDNGIHFDFGTSRENRLLFTTAFHHMNDGGYYDGWTEHNVIVKPSLAWDIDLKITGRDRRDIKDYLHECFRAALTELVHEYEVDAVIEREFKFTKCYDEPNDHPECWLVLRNDVYWRLPDGTSSWPTEHDAYTAVARELAKEIP